VTARRALVAALAGLVLACWVASPAWADDWDGLGFLASIDHFDLASFAPHPPGYPVYVACLKVAAWFASSPIAAARVVAVLSGALTCAAVWLALPVEADARPVPRAIAAVCVCATPLAFRAFSGVGSEGPALAFAALALAAVAAPPSHLPLPARAVVLGLAVGLGLGVRLSWAPFYLPFLVLVPEPQAVPSVRGARPRIRVDLRACLVAAVACLAWAIPLVVLTGRAKLVALYRTQANGHFGRWGGTALTDPVRARFLARDLLSDGFGAGTDLLGGAVLLALAGALVATMVTFRRSQEPAPPLLRPLLVAGVPYLVWITFGQNLREQPRHALPLVFLLACALASGALRARPPIRPLFLALALLVLTRTSLDAMARRTTPPPGAQLLDYLRTHAPLATSALFAGASSRFLDGTEWQPRTHPAGSLPDALLTVAHLDRIPVILFLTSELTSLDESPAPLADVATFCRPPRIDRSPTCLHLYALGGKAAFAR